MANAHLELFLRQVHRMAATEGLADATDGQLLERFRARQEAPFAALLHRHGPMVLGVARRVLRQEQDAEDVFQATFLLLARKADSIRQRESVGSWLHGVAYRLAAEAKTQGVRRQARERAKAMRQQQSTREEAWQELEEALDQALAQLPESYRQAVVLCCLEGKTQEEAARQLGCPLGTVRSRLARGRERLRKHLAGRGMILSAGALATFLAASAASAALPAPLLHRTKGAALQAATGTTLTGIVSPRVAALVEGATKAMVMTKVKAVVALLVALGVLAAGAGVCARQAVSANNPAAGEENVATTRAEEHDPKAAEEKAGRADWYGDPLPAGALARLGTVRFRHQEMVGHAVFSADSKTLIAGDRGGPLIFWDAATGKELRRIAVPFDSVCCLAVSPDGKTLATGGIRKMLLWDLTTGLLVRAWEPPQMRSLLFSPDGKTLASRAYDDLIYLWDPATGDKRHELKGHRGQINAFTFSADSKQLASCSREDNVVRLWDVASGQEVRQLKGHDKGVLAVAWSPDGKTVASTSSDWTLRFWDPATGLERARTKKDDVHGVAAPLAYLPDGSALVSLHSSYQTIRLYDPATGKVLRSFAPAVRSMVDLAIAPDGKRIACSGGGAHTPELWDVATGKLLGAEGHRQPVRCLAFTADGKMLFSGSGTTEYAVRVWGPATGKELRRVGEGSNGSDALALSPDGTLLAVPRSGDLTSDGVSLCDPATDRELRRLKHPGTIVSLGFSADGRRLASCSLDNGNSSIRLWDVVSGKPGVEIDMGQDGPAPAALSPDGKVVAALGYQGGIVQVWDADTGRKLRQFETGEKLGGPTSRPLAFAPDGRVLAVGGWRGTTGLWDPSTGKLLRRLDDPSNWVAALAFAPDGRTLVSGGDGIRLWEVATGEVRATLTGHTGAVSSLAFTRDGRLLASGSFDTTILTWDLAGPVVQKTHPDLDALWADLAGDTAKAYQAVRALAATPKQAVPFLRERVKPVLPLAAADRERFARLLADLDNDAFAVREKAAAELEKQGAAVEPLVRQALAGKPGPEVRRRLEKLLEDLDAQSPNRLRLLRGVEVLEYANGAEARRLLEELAGGAPEAWLTREAKESLERLEKRSVPAP